MLALDDPERPGPVVVRRIRRLLDLMPTPPPSRPTSPRAVPTLALTEGCGCPAPGSPFEAGACAPSSASRSRSPRRDARRNAGDEPGEPVDDRRCFPAPGGHRRERPGLPRHARVAPRSAASRPGMLKERPATPLA
ncbi:hypothetical protein DSL92_06645 [Billgrantia gudaonensis]|uniref:Uncharacterized protein n=1 Tax=Billgrantia gudaonensis TaxID=376427 RepID=A0A3S0NEL4_9GAMM|nr:hypothetical protein DSL92_06645 [Halomonas gudaonensis]